jgi:NADH-ubiquinone oxidoreductase chain 6
MEYLFLIKESLTNGYIINSLDIISIFAILFAILVIIDNNPIISLLFLIGLFLSVSMYLNIIGLTFIGLSYLVIYIGAVSILFIFILMLINIRTSELQNNTSNSLSLALIVTMIFNYIIWPILPNNINKSLYDYMQNIIFYSKNYNYKSYVTSSNWDNNLIENNHITSIGNIMYTNFSIWLIIASLILILAMVGAIVITIKQEK